MTILQKGDKFITYPIDKLSEMSDLFPRHLTTKKGESLLIREAHRTDAPALIDYVSIVAGETEFLTFGAGEFNLSAADEEAFIEKSRQAPNQLVIVAVLDGQIIGMLNVHASPKKRLQHIGEFGITVLKAHWGKGVGARLMEGMIDWAKATKLMRKLNLKVHVNNAGAIRMYERFGFEREGRIRRDACIDGRFYDTYCMGLLID